MEGKEIPLKSGKVAILQKFQGSHVREAYIELAQRGDALDEASLLFVLMTYVLTIDGKGVTFEDLDNMPGQDTLTLQNAFKSEAGGEAADATRELLEGEKRLPSGKIVKVEEFLGRHVREAQRYIADMSKDKRIEGGADKNVGTMLFVLVSMLCTLDGVGIVYEDLDTMDGMDVLMLMGHFSAASFR